MHSEDVKIADLVGEHLHTQKRKKRKTTIGERR
jgi:hypothetical protein